MRGSGGTGYGLRGAGLSTPHPPGSRPSEGPLEGWNEQPSPGPGGLLEGETSGDPHCFSVGAPGELVHTLLERVPGEHLNTMMARFLGASR